MFQQAELRSVGIDPLSWFESATIHPSASEACHRTDSSALRQQRPPCLEKTRRRELSTFGTDFPQWGQSFTGSAGFTKRP